MRDERPLDEEALAELLALLPPAPVRWVSEAQARPFARHGRLQPRVTRELADVEAHEHRPRPDAPDG